MIMVILMLRGFPFFLNWIFGSMEIFFAMLLLKIENRMGNRPSIAIEMEEIAPPAPEVPPPGAPKVLREGAPEGAPGVSSSYLLRRSEKRSEEMREKT